MFQILLSALLAMFNKRAPCSRNKLTEDVKQILESSSYENIFSDMDTCQITIDGLSDDEVNEKLTVVTKYDSLKKNHFDNRSHLIEHIPDFWKTAIENHPDLSALVDNDEVRDIFRYVTKIDLESLKGGHLKITVFLKENPYIENKVLVKEFIVGDNEENIPKIAKIIWKNNLKYDQEQPSTSRKRSHDELNFFDWYADENANDDLTSTQFYAMWENPIAFYMMGRIDDSDEEEETDQSVEDED